VDAHVLKCILNPLLFPQVKFVGAGLVEKIHLSNLFSLVPLVRETKKVVGVREPLLQIGLLENDYSGLQ